MGLQMAFQKLRAREKKTTAKLEQTNKSKRNPHFFYNLNEKRIIISLLLFFMWFNLLDFL